jgi:tetratricopeptide (TPR) repeat protein
VWGAVAGAGAQQTSGLAGVEEVRALIASNHLHEADEVLTNLIERDPENTGLLLELGELRLKQGMNDAALQAYEKVLAEHPTNASARAGEVQAAVAAALADRRAGNQDAALRHLAEGRGYVADSPELLTDFGIQAESMRLFVDAEAALNQALQLATGDARTLYALARVETDRGEYAEAEVNLRKYLMQAPDDATALYGLGHVLHLESRDDEAKVKLERSIALHPHQTESFYDLGEIALNFRKDADARADYDKVLALAPNHGGALTGMGILACRRKDFQAAETYLEKAVAAAPNYAPAHIYYSLALRKLGDDKKAQTEAALAAQLTTQERRQSRGNQITTQPQ